MFVKVNNCPICENPSYSNFIICKDYTVSGESFAIVQCADCGLKYTNPRPAPSVIDQYYESENYISHSNKGNNLVNLAYKLVRNFTIKSKIGLIEKLNTGNEYKLLDVGCGTGEFLKAYSDRGRSAEGIEPNLKAREAAVRKTGITIHENFDSVNAKFNIITLWHVIEHMSNLNEIVDQLKKLLKKNGKLIIAVPNCNSYDASFFKEYWAAYDVPRHFYHFSPDTMKTLLKVNKLKLSKIVPMKFDAYYVALLSNRYKFGRNKYTKSILTGYKSNSYARKNQNNYSSLIYIINK
jgi:2-polyprenyl-3-methyl-5-hydroxy-6-metoxy-1,4-benzoquinol methylase